MDEEVYLRASRGQDLFPAHSYQVFFASRPRRSRRIFPYQEALRAFNIRAIEYYLATVRDDPGEGFALLSALASEGVISSRS